MGLIYDLTKLTAPPSAAFRLEMAYDHDRSLELDEVLDEAEAVINDRKRAWREQHVVEGSDSADHAQG